MKEMFRRSHHSATSSRPRIDTRSLPSWSLALASGEPRATARSRLSKARLHHNSRSKTPIEVSSGRDPATSWAEPSPGGCADLGLEDAGDVRDDADASLTHRDPEDVQDVLGQVLVEAAGQVELVDPLLGQLAPQGDPELTRQV